MPSKIDAAPSPPSPSPSAYSLDLDALGGSSDDETMLEQQKERVLSDDIDGPTDFTLNMGAFLGKSRASPMQKRLPTRSVIKDSLDGSGDQTVLRKHVIKDSLEEEQTAQREQDLLDEIESLKQQLLSRDEEAIRQHKSELLERDEALESMKQRDQERTMKHKQELHRKDQQIETMKQELLIMSQRLDSQEQELINQDDEMEGMRQELLQRSEETTRHQIDNETQAQAHSQELESTLKREMEATKQHKKELRACKKRHDSTVMINSVLKKTLNEQEREIKTLRGSSEQVSRLKAELRGSSDQTERVKQKLKEERSKRIELEGMMHEAAKKLVARQDQMEVIQKELDERKEERKLMVKTLLHQWGREECGSTDPQQFRYKYVRKA